MIESPAHIAIMQPRPEVPLPVGGALVMHRNQGKNFIGVSRATAVSGA